MSIADLKRASRVVEALAKHGLGWVVLELGLKWHLPLGKRLLLRVKEPENLPVRLRKVFEELGGAYLKLGQLLSLRSDLVPQEYCDEFKKLLDHVPPIRFAIIEHRVRTELAQSLGHMFSYVEPKPLGSASVAQVHYAKLKDGREVVIKVQRPSVQETFEADIHIMRYLAHKLEKNLALGFFPSAIVDEFERYTKDELNFLIEAKNLEEMSAAFKDSSLVVIPRVDWKHTTKRVLVMSYVPGVKLSELGKKKLPLSRKSINKRLVDAMTTQVFEQGIFHADLHPGNIVVLPNGKIGLLDFGIVGRLSRDLRQKGLRLYIALVEKNIDVVVEQLFHIGIATEQTDRTGLREEVGRIVRAWHGTTLQQARPTMMMQQLAFASACYNLRLPVDLVLLGKALVTLEGTCAQLDPAFNFAYYSQPLIAKLLVKEQTPTALAKRWLEQSREIAQTLAQIPEETLDAVRTIKEGRIRLEVQDTDIKHLGMDVATSSNRLAYAVMISAFIIAAAMLVDVGPVWNGYPVFTLIGLIGAVLFTFPLFVSILREGSIPYDQHKNVNKR